MELDCVCFTLIIDDIVFPDGTTCMAQLGGGGSQSLFGFQLVSGSKGLVGLAAGVGTDLPESCKDWLYRIKADTSGLILHSRQTPRAWQIFESDGRRTQVYRHLGDPCDELYEMLRPKVDDLPESYKHAKSYHIGIHPQHPPLSLLRTLRQAAHAQGGLLSVEPYTASDSLLTSPHLGQLLSACDIFSPNELEAESMVGRGSPQKNMMTLLDASPCDGAQTIVIRCGDKGAMAATRKGPSQDSSIGFMLPAVEDTQVVDVTGCGNAFCGGFLASFIGKTGKAGDLLESLAWGSTAASFMAEEKGVPKMGVLQLKVCSMLSYHGMR
ncbi:hypothetical protein CEUSTIGMA_g606.t1 [Chlamydomonas eustigma]|uniref:Carbohydrate kinase PfkB domain-containing protein n=1 Tax=Chlamydomonas eustigma TaxID=1157962 RepID=A0A250WQR0_9CHLO|nr:hypothetical protein CEUSTIGMA_g606.t1 [Chlamydomonas eustigma]|eukprot:GAX73153.1 hypothetical protein CEUSTIGMA_g606.t1 [Chlamydomonas eustigma]